MFICFGYLAQALDEGIDGILALKQFRFWILAIGKRSNGTIRPRESTTDESSLIFKPQGFFMRSCDVSLYCECHFVVSFISVSMQSLWGDSGVKSTPVSILFVGYVESGLFRLLQVFFQRGHAVIVY